MTPCAATWAFEWLLRIGAVCAVVALVVLPVRHAMRRPMATRIRGRT